MTYIIKQALKAIISAEKKLSGKISIGEGFLSPQAKEVVPENVDQIVTPGNGYDCLSEVTVKAVPYEEVQNTAGGITVKIG